MPIDNQELTAKELLECHFCEEIITNNDYIPYWHGEGQVICDICQENMGEYI